MKKLIFILIAFPFVASAVWYNPLTWGGLQLGATPALTVPQGGTGWGNIKANTFLTGNGTGKLATTTVGTGLSLSGGTLSNSAPDQTVVLTNGTNVTITGTYPNFTINSTGGTGGISFSPDTNYGVQVYSTSTPTLWFKNGLYASSTSIFTAASTTNIGSTGNAYFATLGGNVGIGTTSPTSALSIVSNSITTPTLALDLKSGQTADYLQLHNANGSLVLKFTADGVWRPASINDSIIFGGFNSSQINPILLLDTTLGGAGLKIDGGTNKSADIILDRGNTGNTSAIYMQTGGVNKFSLTLRDDATDNFGIYAFGPNAYVFNIQNTTGNVGIGTTTPTNKLQVNGTTATSTISATVVNGSVRSTTLGGKIILQDVAGGTCTEITTQSGVMSSQAVACP